MRSIKAATSAPCEGRGATEVREPLFLARRVGHGEINWLVADVVSRQQQVKMGFTDVSFWFTGGGVLMAETLAKLPYALPLVFL